MQKDPLRCRSAVHGAFTLPAGGYTLTFAGLNPNGGNNVALIDSVTLNNSLVPNGSFESPVVSDHRANPSDLYWTFNANSGLAHNGGTYTSGNPSAPDGSQVAFIQNNGLLSQIWTASAGTYTLSFKAAQRGTGNSSSQQLKVNLRPSGSAISTKLLVWCGNEICEERDVNYNVTKRYFAEGEQRVGGSDAGNYYYSRDHLGSIREVTDANGDLVTQLDYDVWGNEVVVSGAMNIDFGFTGQYFHQPSGLNLTLYRAYNPTLGRWISRDPLASGVPFLGLDPSRLKPGVQIGERFVGSNLYPYVNNDPLDQVDPLGLIVNLYAYTYKCEGIDPVTMIPRWTLTYPSCKDDTPDADKCCYEAVQLYNITVATAALTHNPLVDWSASRVAYAVAKIYYNTCMAEHGF